MKINLKHSKNKWVDIDGESQFLIDYPTIEQADEIKRLAYQIAFLDEEILLTTTQKQREKILTSLTRKDKADMLILSEQLYRKTFQYSVKDWKGINDEDGKKVECVIVNGEIEDGLFSLIIRELGLTELAHIYTCISNETEFTESDKKK